jgi:hypothetical protein
MDELSKYQKNFNQLELSSTYSLGFYYFTACIPTVLSLINKDVSIVEPLIDSIEGIEIGNLSEEDSLYIATRSYLEFFKNAKSISNKVPPPILMNQNWELEDFCSDLEKYSGKGFNGYLSIPNSGQEYFKLVRFTDLIFIIGYLLERFEMNEMQSMKLGYMHSNYWLISPNGLSYSSSVIYSNILPTHFANVINSFPFPESFYSQPENWLFSKELDCRIKDPKYKLDESTMRWIWGFHNYIFYVNDPQVIELKNQYKEKEGFNLMLSDIFKNIDSYNKIVPLKSKKLKFVNSFKSDDNWNNFLNLVNTNTKEDFGQSHIDSFYGKGDLCSFYSFRYIHAVKLFLKQKGWFF